MIDQPVYRLCCDRDSNQSKDNFKRNNKYYISQNKMKCLNVVLFTFFPQSYAGRKPKHPTWCFEVFETSAKTAGFSRSLLIERLELQG